MKTSQLRLHMRLTHLKLKICSNCDKVAKCRPRITGGVFTGSDLSREHKCSGFEYSKDLPEREDKLKEQYFLDSL